MEYERQVASVRAQTAAETDFSVSQAEMSSRQAMLENASDIKVGLCPIVTGFAPHQGSVYPRTRTAVNVI